MASSPANSGDPGVAAYPEAPMAAGGTAGGGINSIMSAAYGLSSLSGPNSQGQGHVNGIGSKQSSPNLSTTASATGYDAAMYNAPTPSAAMAPSQDPAYGYGTGSMATTHVKTEMSMTMMHPQQRQDPTMMMAAHPQHYPMPMPPAGGQHQHHLMPQHYHGHGHPMPMAMARGPPMQMQMQVQSMAAPGRRPPAAPGPLAPNPMSPWSPSPTMSHQIVAAPGMAMPMPMSGFVDPSRQGQVHGHVMPPAVGAVDPAHQHHARAMAMDPRFAGAVDSRMTQPMPMNPNQVGIGGRMTINERTAAAAVSNQYDPYAYNPHTPHAPQHPGVQVPVPGGASSLNNMNPMTPVSGVPLGMIGMGAPNTTLPLPLLPTPHQAVSSSSSSNPNKNFPETLFDIICSSDENAHIISWLPHGKGFIINDKQRFASMILLRYFDGAKFTSFTRRLKRWSFVRVARGPEMGAYYNKNFSRDRPDLVQKMRYRTDGLFDDGGGKDDDGADDDSGDGGEKQRVRGRGGKFECRDEDSKGDNSDDDDNEDADGKKSPEKKRRMILPVKVHSPGAKTRLGLAKLREVPAPPLVLMPSASSKKSKSSKKRTSANSAGSKRKSRASPDQVAASEHPPVAPTVEAPLMPRRYPSLVSPNDPVDERQRMEREMQLGRPAPPGAMGTRIPHEMAPGDPRLAGDPRLGDPRLAPPGGAVVAPRMPGDPRLAPPGGVAPRMPHELMPNDPRMAPPGGATPRMPHKVMPGDPRLAPPGGAMVPMPPMAAGMSLHHPYYPVPAGGPAAHHALQHRAEHAKRLSVENAHRVLAADAAERAFGAASFGPPPPTAALHPTAGTGHPLPAGAAALPSQEGGVGSPTLSSAHPGAHGVAPAHHMQAGRAFQPPSAALHPAVDHSPPAAYSFPPTEGPASSPTLPPSHPGAYGIAAAHHMQAPRLPPQFVARPPEHPSPRLGGSTHGGAASVSSMEWDQRGNMPPAASAPVGDRLVPMSREEEAEYAEYLFMKQKVRPGPSALV